MASSQVRHELPLSLQEEMEWAKKLPELFFNSNRAALSLSLSQSVLGALAVSGRARELLWAINKVTQILTMLFYIFIKELFLPAA